MLDRLRIGLDSLVGVFADSQWLFVLIIGASITLFFFAAFSIVSTIMNPVRRQMRSLSLVGDASQRKRSSDRFDNRLLSLSRLVLPRSEKEIYKVKKKLSLAGLRRDSDLVYFFLSKILLSLVFGLSTLVATTYSPDLPGVKVLFFVSLGFAVGMLIPSYVLDRKITRRKLRIVNGFPDMLDLMVACSEAGLGLNSALQRVCREIQYTHPDLAREIKIVNAEMLGGVDRVVALRGLSERTEIDDISGFVAMLSQSIRFGTGIAETLRIYAEEFRDKRMQRAEEAAQKVGTKLLFPLVLCMFPAFFIVAVGPAAISIIQAFGN